MEKKALLLSGLGGSLFPYLHIHLASKHDLYYLDSDENLKHLYPDLNLFLAPPVTDEKYWDLVTEIIRAKNIAFYIPLIDEEIIPAILKIGELTTVGVMTPTKQFSELCLNKLNLMLRLQQLGISSIRSCRGDAFDWEVGPPIFVKPVSGRGSRGIRKIVSKEQLQGYYSLENYAAADILIQEHIVGVEYTVGVTINPLNQILEISIKRIIKKRGITQIAVTEHNNMIKATVQKVVDSLRPGGPINIQLFVTPDHDVKIFEINPRFSTTTIMSYAAGIDVISLYMQYFEKSFEGPPLEPREGIVLHRRWESVFYEK